MKKTVLVFGLISGLISAVMMAINISLSKRCGSETGMIIGYAIIILSLTLVFFGIRSYRDSIGNGTITFGKAFGVGLLICLVSCLLYVISWEIIFFNFMPDFLDNYNKSQLEQLKASGASEATLTATMEEMKQFQVMYKNPLFNAAMTFLEPFPVGLIITLISALILKKKPAAQTA